LKLEALALKVVTSNIQARRGHREMSLADTDDIGVPRLLVYDLSTIDDPTLASVARLEVMMKEIVENIRWM